MWQIVILKREKLQTYEDADDTYVCRANETRSLTDSFWRIEKIYTDPVTWEVSTSVAWVWDYVYQATDLTTVKGYTYK